MFKLIRKYQKLLLAVCCSLLMIAFLLPSAGSIFAPKQGHRLVGFYNGEEKIIEKDLREAEAILATLENAQRYNNALLDPTILGDETGTDASLRFALLRKEAEALNLYASQQEVMMFWADRMGDISDIQQAANKLGTTPDTMLISGRVYLQLQALAALHRGEAYYHDDGLEWFNQTADGEAVDISETIPAYGLGYARSVQQYRRVQPIANYINYMRQMAAYDPSISQQMYYLMGQIASQSHGNLRASVHALRAGIYQNQTTLNGRLIAIGTDSWTQEVEVSEQDIQSIFERNKDQYPGEGDHGFGYRFADRVGGDILTISMEQVLPIAEKKFNLERDKWIDYYGSLNLENSQDATVRANARTRYIESLQLEIIEEGLYAANRLINEAIRTQSTPPTPEALITCVKEAIDVTPELINQSLENAVDFGANAIYGSAITAENRSLRQLLFTMPAFIENDEEIANTLKAGQWAPYATSPDGIGIIYFIREISPDHPATSVEEVREQAEADAMELARFQKLTNPEIIAGLRNSFTEAPSVDNTETSALVRFSNDNELREIKAFNALSLADGLSATEYNMLESQFNIKDNETLTRQIFDIAETHDFELESISETNRFTIFVDEESMQVIVLVVDSASPIDTLTYQELIKDSTAVWQAINPPMFNKLNESEVTNPLSLESITDRLEYLPSGKS